MKHGLALAALAVALIGCDDSGALDPESGLFAEDDLDAAAAPLSDDDDEGLPTGGIIAPDRVEVYVGEELLLDVRVEDPRVGVLRATSLPEGSDFESLNDGGIVHWRPEPDDVGSHTIIFLMEDESNLVIGTTATVIDVLPRLDLIEYGF